MRTFVEFKKNHEGIKKGHVSGRIAVDIANKFIKEGVAVEISDPDEAKSKRQVYEENLALKLLAKEEKLEKKTKEQK